MILQLVSYSIAKMQISCAVTANLICTFVFASQIQVNFIVTLPLWAMETDCVIMTLFPIDVSQNNHFVSPDMAVLY